MPEEVTRDEFELLKTEVERLTNQLNEIGPMVNTLSGNFTRLQQVLLNNESDVSQTDADKQLVHVSNILASLIDRLDLRRSCAHYVNDLTHDLRELGIL